MFKLVGIDSVLMVPSYSEKTERIRRGIVSANPSDNPYESDAHREAVNWMAERNIEVKPLRQQQA